jgi:tetratricopeptide (TPR) repeat protein
MALSVEKKRDEAVTALRQALDLACKDFGQEDAACVETMQMLAKLLAQMGKFEEAEQLFREVVKLNEKFGDPNDEEVDDSRRALIAILVKQGKEEAAKEFLKEGDPPLPAPKASASAAASAAPSAKSIAKAPTKSAAPVEDNRDAWTQIIDELHEEKAAKKPARTP